MKKISAETVGFKQGERNVFFHLLTACNLTCRHCYINPDQHGVSTVSKQTLESWLKLFVSKKKKTNIVFLGGEPTLHPDLPYGVRLAKQLGYQTVTIDTNGFLFHDLLEKITPEQLDFLSFSLDGPSAEINDSIRGQGVFDVCTKNLRRAVAKGFNVSLIYTVSRLNIAYLQEMPPLLAEWGVKRFFVQVIGLRGKSGQNSNDTLQLSPQEWLNAVPAAAETAAKLGVHVTFPKVFLERGEVFECAANVSENYFVFPNGRVYLCPLVEDYALNAYRIEENTLVHNTGFTEQNLFALTIPEGCVMNKILQSENIPYDSEGKPQYRISCCLLKQEMRTF